MNSYKLLCLHAMQTDSNQLMLLNQVMPDSDLFFYKSESGMIIYFIQPVFRSDFYLTEIQALIESVYRLVSSYCRKILYHVCIQPRIRQEKKSDLNQTQILLAV